MKNMRSFSLVALSTMLLLSGAPVVAMEGPEFDFHGVEQAATQLYGKLEQNAKAGYAIASAKAKEGVEAATVMFNNTTEQVSAAGKELAEATKVEFKNFKDGVVHAYNNATAASVVEAIAPQEKAGFSLKGFFSKAAESIKNNGSKLKETVKAHPVITGAVVAAIVAVPFVIFGLKKAQKNKKTVVVVKAA